MSKCTTRLLRHSKQVRREEDGGVHYDQVIEECKKKSSDDTGYWSDEKKNQFALAPHWSLEKWISVLAKGGGLHEICGNFVSILSSLLLMT